MRNDRAIIFVDKNSESTSLDAKAKAELMNKTMKRSLPNEEKFIRTALQIKKIDDCVCSSFSILNYKCQKWQCNLMVFRQAGILVSP